MNALYYPFHLCHVRTLEALLANYHTAHFRDFMALQLTPMMGTTAYPDRMGDYHPEHLQAGRIIQGYNVSGALGPETIRAVDRDLIDPQWRRLFQSFMLKNTRFQRGLFGEFQTKGTGSLETLPEPEWHQFLHETWATRAFEVHEVQNQSQQRLHGEKAAQFEYGWALIKTSASLVYTIQLCRQHRLIAVTDSPAHYDLLNRTCKRDNIGLENFCVIPKGNEWLSWAKEESRKTLDF